LKIIRLQAENIKRIKAIDITPKEDVIIISGNNGMGKTSVLDSIFYALQNREGSKTTPQPIRKGESKAQVTLTLDDFIVTRSWTSDDKSYLKVTNREGLTYNSPQELLDGFLGALTFNPLEFSNMKEKDQRDLLLRLANVDIDSYDEKIKTLTEYRRLQGQKVKLYEGERDTRDFSGVPDKEIDIAEWQSKLEEAIELNHNIDESVQKIDRLETSNINDRAHIATLLEKIEEIKRNIVNSEKLLKRERQWVDSVKKVDIEYIRKSINASLAINEMVQAKNRNIQADKKRDSAQKVYDKFTTDIGVVQKQKYTALHTAKMPIEGLGVNDSFVTYNGIPFCQLSSSEQLKVSMSIAIALNPKLRVIRVTDGSLLDDNNMKVIKDMAKDNDFQIWVEKISDLSGIAFVIEDGEVKNG